MPGKPRRLKLVLCAALTADGKLDTALPPILSENVHRTERHPWGSIYDAAAGVLVDSVAAGELPMPSAAVRTVAGVDLSCARGATEAQQEVAATLRRLWTEGLRGDLLCFGGAALFRIVLEGGLADELRLLVRPRIDGRRDAPGLIGAPGDFFPASVRCRLLKMEVLGDECLLHYRVLRAQTKRPAADETGASGAR